MDDLFINLIWVKINNITDELDKLCREVRTRKNLLLLADKIRVLEAQRIVLIEIYDEYKRFFG